MPDVILGEVVNSKSWLKAAQLERVESAYLHALRVAGLLIATLCLIAAIVFAANASWRLFVKTDIQPEATAVDTNSIALAIAAERDESKSSTSANDSISVAHDVFKKNVWPKYYDIYKTAHQKHLNSADTLISSDDLMAALSYDLATYRQAMASSDEAEVMESYYAQRILRMINSKSYQDVALKHVAEVIAAPAVQTRLTQYKGASKSEQRCTTTPRSERVYQTCGYYYVYDCSYTRTVQDRRCEAVFPESVLTPVAAFEQADRLFAEEWMSDEDMKSDVAADIRAERMETRSKIAPNLQMALAIIGGFFIVMFFFLLVAIERHLRPAKPNAQVETKTENND